ncbi:hypothetical protein JTE90_021793 [Oedothorax gibbosus]|uniref:C2H2-type domain-containing protein n=1 Tax=Oedothorax gibbosus TaxID=931172 RepID=A0AAV6TNA1_9ARAC|nr:hypothetical protein JTE90_021793 [Oedothorax gibbosus]
MVSQKERNYTCEACFAAFYTKGALKQHSFVHSDERPHLCCFCSSSFKLKTALDQHMKSHTGIKPYVCEDCNRSFTSKRNMVLHHARIHTIMKPGGNPRDLLPDDVKQETLDILETWTGPDAKVVVETDTGTMETDEDTGPEAEVVEVLNE